MFHVYQMVKRLCLGGWDHSTFEPYTIEWINISSIQAKDSFFLYLDQTIPSHCFPAQSFFWQIRILSLSVLFSGLCLSQLHLIPLAMAATESRK